MPRRREVTVRNIRRTTRESSIRSSKALAGILIRDDFEMAVTLAVRGALSRRAISPTTSPGPSVARTTSRSVPVFVTRNSPSTMTNMSSDRESSSMMVVSASSSILSDSLHTWSSRAWGRSAK